MDLKTEKSLIERAKKDPREFAHIYQHYHPHIRRFFAAKLRHSEVVDDLTSITFEKALNNLDKFSWQGYSLSAWLYRIAYNTLTDYFRKSKDSRKVAIDKVRIQSLEKTPEEEVEIESEAKALALIMNELEPKEREIIYLKFFDGYTNKVIAAKTGLSETNISTIVHRTLQKMRNMLK